MKHDCVYLSDDWTANNMSDFRFPGHDEHTVIVGTNGTGKTQFGAWILSMKNLATTRNFIIDYKGDELLNGIRRSREISVTDKLPKENGLYIIHAVPFEAEQERMRRWLYNIWNDPHGATGLFFDEGYMAPGEKGGPFQALLTQGRSLGISCTVLTQRPVAVNRFVYSESNHKIIFELNDDRDKDVIREFTPKGFVDWTPDGMGVKDPHSDELFLPKYHSRWYNKPDRSRFLLRPAPSASEIIDAIDVQLKPVQRWL